MTTPESATPLSHAIILSAGLGRRMRPLTALRPKPLIEVAGKTLLDRGLERLREAGIGTVVVNVHYLASMLELHLGHCRDPRVVISDERDELLETGGGIARALPHLGDGPFVVMNSDSFWIEGMTPNLQRLADAWNDERMDGLLLLAPHSNSVGYAGHGDFTLDGDGRVRRRGEGEVAPFIYSGTALLHPRLFKDCPMGAFSLNMLFDRAIESDRLYGLRLDGIWLHVGTPEAIAEAEAAIATSVL